MLVDGQWTEDWQPVQESDEDGRFIRQRSGFRATVSPDSPEGFTPASGRYHLYLAYICPWACRISTADFPQTNIHGLQTSSMLVSRRAQATTRLPASRNHPSRQARRSCASPMGIRAFSEKI